MEILCTGLFQEWVKNVEEKQGSQRGCPLPLAFHVALLPGECWRAGGRAALGEAMPLHCSWHLCQPFRALKIGLGNSLKVITWDSGNSRWLLRAAPKCSWRCILSCSLSVFSLFFMFISGCSQTWGIHELLLSGFFFFKPNPLFLWKRKKLAPQCPVPLWWGSRRLVLVIVNYL